MSEYKELCTWLKNNSSGVYRQCFDAANIIECMEGAQIIQDETIKALQQQNTALQQQVKDLQADNNRLTQQNGSYKGKLKKYEYKAAIK